MEIPKVYLWDSNVALVDLKSKLNIEQPKMKLVYFIFIILIPISVFGQKFKFEDAIFWGNLPNGFYICLPFIEDGKKKILVSSDLSLQIQMKKHGFTEEEYHTYIKRKIIDRDTVDITMFETKYMKSHIITQRLFHKYFGSMKLKQIIDKYVTYDMKLKTSLDESFNDALIYKLFINRILVSKGCEDGELYITISYSNVSSKFE